MNPQPITAVFSTAEYQKYKKYANFGVVEDFVDDWNKTIEEGNKAPRQSWKNFNPNNYQHNWSSSSYSPNLKSKALSPLAKTVQGALLLGGIVGIGHGINKGIEYTRRRRSKTGKPIIERVRKRS